MRKVQKRPTRADVARLAGVSVATVSFALKQDPRISIPTTQKVMEAATQLGYKPSMLAQSLQSGVTHTLGLVMPDISNPYFGRLAEELEQTAAQHGRTLLVNLSHGDPTVERIRISELFNRQVDAIFISSAQSDEDLEKLSKAGQNIVLLDRTQPVGNLHSVSSDLRQAAYDATMHLIEHGKQHITILAGSSNLTDPRVVGWREAQKDAHIEPGPIVNAGFTAHESHQATSYMLQEEHLTMDAIFAVSDLTAVGALRALREQGWQVPKDILLVSLDGTFVTQFTSPQLTAIHQDTASIARSAVAAALNNDAPSTQIIPTELVLGESCGCIPLNT